MRFWVQLHRLHEMVENLPDDVCDEEKSAIARLCFNQETRGTLLSQAAQFTGATATIRASKHPRKTDLRQLGPEVYLAALVFAQRTWPHLNLKHDQLYSEGGMLFLSGQVAELLNFIYKSGVRYGCTSSRRTLADRYILARLDAALVACCIEHHLKLTVGSEAPVYAVAVCRFVIPDPQPQTPWDLHAEDLGYYVALADELGALEFITTDQIFSPVGLATVSTCTGTRLWVAVSYDQTGEESREDAGILDQFEDE
ncbi:hypothetical protein FRC08_007178 [Ceratobasidium sp. 394]|nr:hypothetical protein FRC08_007178 [Ceratobasidium sp. 394]